MNETVRSAAGKYLQAGIETYDQATLITMLYDGMTRFLTMAVEKMNNGEVPFDECRRAQDIVNHLYLTVKDDGSDIAVNLKALYFFFYKQVVNALMEKNAGKIEEILPLVRELRSAWGELKRRNGNDGISR